MSNIFNSIKKFSFICVATLLALRMISPSLANAGDTPANLDHGLRQLLENEAQNKAVAGAQSTTAPQIGMSRRAVRDHEQRVLVNLHLDGKILLSDLRKQIIDGGGKIAAESSEYERGVISAFVPVSKLTQFAQAPGVLSIAMSHRPIRNAGATTSGGFFAIHADTLNANGLTGNGITVGVLSDSYDTATTTLSGDPLSDHAAQDVATDDLPGPGNPNGNTSPVVVLEDFVGGEDEGRAMLQIVHDMAPQANLAFATAFVSEVDFANNIRKLRTNANCDVITDDVFYTSEPMFSDGIIARAVDDVVFSSALAGHKCAYFSSAGNQQGGGYASTFTPVANSTARAGMPNQNVKLSQVPSNLTSGGFHNFNSDPSGPADISQTFLLPGQSALEIDFQWNDPFDKPNGVTTDYNILVFDAAGNYLPQFSGTANNFSNQEPIEDILIENSGNDANFQIVIARSGTTPSSPVAKKLRYLAIDDFGSGIGASEYYQPAAPATFGHSCATGAFGTAAYVYDDNPSNPPGPPFTPFTEDFTSQGPVTIDFDSAGNRLTQSQVRQKPDIAAPDGGNTTFFGFDYEGDGFPNFFGTSAAAPHAAGLAALLLQKAGGPQTLTYQQIKSDLQSSVLNPHDTNPFISAANLTARPSRSSVRISAFGNSSNASSRDPNFFTINFVPGTTGETLKLVTIDLLGAGLKFDSTTASGFPFTLGKLRNISPSSIHNNVKPETSSIRSITLSFSDGTFGSGASVSFGIDRDYIGDGAGNSADLLPGASVTAQTTKTGFSGTFSNTYGFGYVSVDGFGLIDAVKAASFIP